MYNFHPFIFVIFFFLRCVGVMNYNFIQVWASGQKIKYRRLLFNWLLSTIDRICLLHLFFRTIETHSMYRQMIALKSLIYFAFFSISRFDDNAFKLNGRTYARATQSNCRRRALKLQSFTLEKLQNLCQDLYFLDRAINYVRDTIIYLVEFGFLFGSKWNFSRQSTQFIIVLFAHFRYGSYSHIVEMSWRICNHLDNGFHI